jgi:UDP-N-acetyl-D-mannosaminuronate dehydrogenase
MSSKNTTAILERIRTSQAKIGVIGLGYGGMPLAVEFARHGVRRHRVRCRR